jgi:YD repeat-containing protein
MASRARCWQTATGAALLALASSRSALADVVTRTGNFYVGYTDMAYDSGIGVKIERVYNSLENINGIFGWGWGSLYETHLGFENGGLVITEYGSGSTVRYNPINPVKGDVHGLAEVPIGNQFTTTKTGYSRLLRIDKGFVRYQTDNTEYFDLDGRLTGIESNNAQWIKLAYDHGQLSSLIDNFGHKLQFFTNENGHVKRIDSQDGKAAFYSYNANGELIRSEDAEGNVYRYSYEMNETHNLTAVRFPNGQEMGIWYYNGGRVKFLRNRDGALTEYRYSSLNDLSADHSTTLTIQGAGNDRNVTATSFFYHDK